MAVRPLSGQAWLFLAQLTQGLLQGEIKSLLAQPCRGCEQTSLGQALKSPSVKHWKDPAAAHAADRPLGSDAPLGLGSNSFTPLPFWWFLIPCTTSVRLQRVAWLAEGGQAELAGTPTCTGMAPWHRACALQGAVGAAGTTDPLLFRSLSGQSTHDALLVSLGCNRRGEELTK